MKIVLALIIILVLTSEAQQPKNKKDDLKYKSSLAVAKTDYQIKFDKAIDTCFGVNRTLFFTPLHFGDLLGYQFWCENDSIVDSVQDGSRFYQYCYNG